MFFVAYKRVRWHKIKQCKLTDTSHLIQSITTCKLWSKGSGTIGSAGPAHL